MEPSRWWTELKGSPQGRRVLRDCFRQVLLALAAVHSAGAAHRDVKPENILVAAAAEEEQASDDGNSNSSGGSTGRRLRVRLCDLGSAVDAHSIAELYGAKGPSAAEETPQYAPPEATFGASAWRARAGVSGFQRYDLWSAGVLGLELLALGTPAVFAPSARAAAVLSARIRGAPAPVAASALALRGLLELCISPPVAADQGALMPWCAARRPVLLGCATHHLLCRQPALRRPTLTRAAGRALRRPSWRGSENATRRVRRRRRRLLEGVTRSLCQNRALQFFSSFPPAGHGLSSVEALRLIRRLLSWDPAARISAEEAAQHPFFAEEGGA